MRARGTDSLTCAFPPREKIASDPVLQASPDCQVLRYKGVFRLLRNTGLRKLLLILQCLTGLPRMARARLGGGSGAQFARNLRTGLLNLKARGVKAADVVVLPYPDHGVKLYGNVIIASPKMIRDNPAASIADVKARDDIVNPELETRCLKMAIDTVINRPNARAEGFGQVNGSRLSLMASQVSDAFNTKTRVNPEAVWNGAFLPTKAELNVLPK